MGNRANYVLIENGYRQTFYSSWDALSIPAVMVRGPEATLAYLRELTPEALLSQTWIEGGILLDVDAHRALFWGGDRIATRPYLRRPLLAALPPLWPDWSINWATYGMADLVNALGESYWKALEDAYDDMVFLKGEGAVVTETQLLGSSHASGPGTLLTIRWSTGEVRDYFFAAPIRQHFNEQGKPLFSAAAYQLLSFGPRVLPTLSNQPGTELPREGSQQEAAEGGLVDEATHSLWVWRNDTLDPRYLEALARRWPGWQVHGHVEGLVYQVSLSGRDPTSLKVPEKQAIDELFEELMQYSGIDLVLVKK